MVIYGYCRISKKKQNIQRQIRNILEAFPTAIVIQEVFTRTSFVGRKKWNKLMKIVKAGDYIIFDSVSRMSGSAEEGFKLYKELYEKGVNLVFLKEPHISTDTYRKALETNKIDIQIDTDSETMNEFTKALFEIINKLLMNLIEENIKKAFESSELEIQQLHQRTKEGIETARLAGKQIGQKTGVKLKVKKAIRAKEVILKHSVDFRWKS